MEFGVLGPLVVLDEGQPLRTPSPKQRVLLACLLLRSGDLVTIDELAEALWGEALPADPRRVVQTYVARLRKLLGAGLIQRRSGGYVLAVDGDQTDQGRFEQLVEQARHAAEAGDRAGESAALRKALALWRGEPLADVPSATLHREAVARLVEQRLEALHRRIDADLALSRHAELVAELRSLTDRYPLREQLWAHLMTALYRSGRQADALDAYQRIRHLLADELGIDPGSELQRLHQAILTGDPALDAPHSPSATAAATPLVLPSQLPLDVDDFVGRDDQVQQIERLITDSRKVPVVALSGPPGVGKTALAVHAGHRLAKHFADGQLYVDLHGATAGLRPLPPLEVLGRFLHALGVSPAAVPADAEEASAAFRSRVAGRRLLVLLDNAADAAQVIWLLPASPGCGVLVTSRRVLSALHGARHLRLDALAAGEALELLELLAGQERVAAEPDAARAIVKLCGRLPLALRIAGARLAARPGWPVRALAERLADQGRRLDELEVAEARVRGSFAVSLEQLQASDDPVDRAAEEAFGLLGLLDGPDVGVLAVAQLLDASDQDTERILERLVDARLLETHTPGRYRMHDLLRLYAQELAAQRHPEPVRAAALTRALGFYVASAWHTLGLLRPGDHRLAYMDDRWRKGGLEFTDDHAALGWLEVERPNLLAAVGQAAATPDVPPEIAIQLAQALFGFFYVHSHWEDCVQANQTVLETASRIGDRAAQARAYNELGGADLRRGQYDRALGNHRQSLALYRELGDRRGQAGSLTNLGVVHKRRGRYEEALACQQESVAICRDLGDPYVQAISLHNLGVVYQRLGRYEEALASQQESLGLCRELGDRAGEAEALNELGVVYQRQGRYAQALARQQESLAIRRELGDRAGEAESLNELGVVYQRLGRCEEALASQQESLALRRELNQPHGQAESLRELGMTLRALGRTVEARAHWLEALAILQRLQTAEANQVRDLLADLRTSTR